MMLEVNRLFRSMVRLKRKKESISNRKVTETHLFYFDMRSEGGTSSSSGVHCHLRTRRRIRVEITTTGLSTFDRDYDQVSIRFFPPKKIEYYNIYDDSDSGATDFTDMEGLYLPASYNNNNNNSTGDGNAALFNDTIGEIVDADAHDHDDDDDDDDDDECTDMNSALVSYDDRNAFGLGLHSSMATFVPSRPASVVPPVPRFPSPATSSRPTASTTASTSAAVRSALLLPPRTIMDYTKENRHVNYIDDARLEELRAMVGANLTPTQFFTFLLCRNIMAIITNWEDREISWVVEGSVLHSLRTHLF